MLIRVSGKLANNASFSTRVEAESAIEAVTITGQKLVKAGESLTNVRNISAQPVKEAGDVYLGIAKTDDEVRAAKEKRAAAKAAKLAAKNSATVTTNASAVAAKKPK